VAPIGARATGDRERLTLVVLNLLDNAARHSPDDGKVLVAARTAMAGSAASGAAHRPSHGANDTGLVLEVSDDGPGIAPEEREHVFERFTRGERASGGGTGLGLAIARWVVRLHGGTIEVNDARPADEPPGCLIRVTVPTATGSGATLESGGA